MRAEDNDLLTRVGPGTPMGELMRQYWMPVAASEEFVAGGDPVRLRVLGENFLGFRFGRHPQCHARRTKRAVYGLPATPYIEPWKHLSGRCVSDVKWTCSKCPHTW